MKLRVLNPLFQGLVLTVLLAAPAAAQHRAQRVATLIVAHGANAEWNQHVRSVVELAKLSGPVRISFLMGPEASTTRFQDAIAAFDSAGVDIIVVVPLLISSHSEHYQQIRYLAGMTDSLDHQLHAHMSHGGLERTTTKTPVRVTSALDDSPIVGAILAERAQALAPRHDHAALFLVGHGPSSAEDHAAWMKNLRALAEVVRTRGTYADVRTEVVRDDAPAAVRAEAVLRIRELISLQHAISRDSVVVVPVLLSRGRISREKFLDDLRGLPVRYSGDPLLPHPGLARWIEAQVGSATRTAQLAPHEQH